MEIRLTENDKEFIIEFKIDLIVWKFGKLADGAEFIYRLKQT